MDTALGPSWNKWSGSGRINSIVGGIPGGVQPMRPLDSDLAHDKQSAFWEDGRMAVTMIATATPTDRARIASSYDEATLSLCAHDSSWHRSPAIISQISENNSKRFAHVIRPSD